jgi:site-specific recombinase XerD
MSALALSRPSLQSLVQLVCDSVPSQHTKRAYGTALVQFFAWQAQTQATFSRATVNAYRTHLEAGGKGGSSINQALSALKRLSVEAEAAGWIDPVTAAGIASVKGVRRLGCRSGNWLSLAQAREMVELPDVRSLAGKRDRVLLGLLFGCGLRRSEAASITVEHVQLREGRPAILDLVGKGGRVRTVGMPRWLYAAIKVWCSAAGITEGPILRPVDKADAISGDRLSAGGVWWIVKGYAAWLGVVLAPHDARRTYCKLARKGGATLESIQVELGHSSIDTTMRYLGGMLDLEHAACDFTGLGQ